MWLNSLLNLVFPPACEVCRRSGEEVLCSGCFSQVKFMKPHMGIYSVSVYGGVVKEALHRFKFQKRKRLAEPLGVLLVKYASQVISLRREEVDCIVPVPLHRLRQRQRGYNQAELLASVVGRYYEIPTENALERIKNTHPQFDLPKEERCMNVAGAFKVSMPEAVYNRKILLLDDIYTTGSTVAECSKALKNAGARQVSVLTLSRAA
ncbi:ComF family protein [Candidatus Saganbacteria bacterium]|uniref:ComF family protein n=1 Tax=Candidatus Saganbacteria bacterium TaxID=2575572 RepID=A0A9D6ULP4_UNCSA|nr:ComF family protein [Candidatus Saganbacteria bacterium]